MPAMRVAAAVAAMACLTEEAVGSLRGNEELSGGMLNRQGGLEGDFALHKKFNLAGPPSDEFDIVEVSDAYLTHSCSDYVNDGNTVFSRNGSLVLKVASHCDGGGCVKSGRVMSKASFTYGIFVFKAKVPKCNYVWPALWLLPGNTNGEGAYGGWPCSGEIDVLETVHNHTFGTFNLIAGYGSSNWCDDDAETLCNGCRPGYCVSTTYNESKQATADRYFIEDVDCSKEGLVSWDEHTFVLAWQPDELATWVDPILTYDESGRLTKLEPSEAPATSEGIPTWRHYRRQTTPTWKAVKKFANQCFKDEAGKDMPFDKGFKIVMNIAVGGYGGSACKWGEDSCQKECGGAVGSELIVSDISVWEMASPEAMEAILP